MSKELEKLKEYWLNHLPLSVKDGLRIVKVLEKKLTRLEELEKTFVALSKEDEKTKKLLSLEIEKNRALEILKNKPHISFDLFDTLNTLEEINKYIEFMYGYKDTSILTKEEYDLLKEVLNNGR